MASRIVVGVDGSDHSVAALRWALEAAHLRGATVDVVHAWHYPYEGDLAELAAYQADHEELEQAAQDVLDRSSERAGETPHGVRVEPILAYSGPASVLLDAPKGAELIVVGTRGRGGFAGLLLGSVSQQCAHSAPCPVAIVPSTWSPA